MHIVMEVYVVVDNIVAWCVDVQHLYTFAAVGASSFKSDVNVHSEPCIGGLLLLIHVGKFTLHLTHPNLAYF